MRTRLALAVLATAIVMAVIPTAASSRADPNFITVASGKFLGRTWEVGLAGDHGRRCFEISLASDLSVSGWSCGHPSRFGEIWQRMEGASDFNDSASAELDFTSPKVRRLDLLVGHPGRVGKPSTRKPGWRRLSTRGLTRAQASKAHLRRNFRFAVLTGAGNICVKRVRAFTRSGRLLEDISVPCEY